MKFLENFDQHKLNHILQNQERFNIKVYEDGYNPFAIATKYLQKSDKGSIRVSYHQPGNRNFGRFFADVSLQNMPREIRHTIASEFYDDVDMVNAHPIILQQLCERFDLVCDRLEDYNENREKHLEDLSEVSREDAKRVFLSIINGGSKDYKSIKKPTKFLKRFKREMDDLLEDVAEKYPTEYERRKISNPENPIGSTVNVVMCDFENQILQCVLKFYQSKGIIDNNCVLCFDGIMIPKHGDTESFINECESYILEKTKFKVQLKIKPMTDGFDFECQPYVEYKNFDPKDEFTWLEFDEKWRGCSFTSMDEVIEHTRSDLNRVFCRVEQGSGFIVKKTDCDENLYDIIDRNSNFTDIFFRYAEDDKVKELSFKRYLQIFSNHINRFRSINFAPNNNDPLLFNLWSGFQAQYGSNSSVELILNHIKEVYCDNCNESYEYFLDLIYYIIKYPEKPLGVATFFYSKKQGSGKNIILDFLEEYVFGKNITHYTTGLDNILEKHNHMLKSKKVVIVDEIASSSDTWLGNFDKLKSMLTGGSLVINPKGVNQYSIKNVLSWFLISNNEDCLKIEASDRRYFCLKVSEKYVGNKQYFKELAATFNQETGDSFFTYIMDRGDERDVNIRIPPMNAFKKHLISGSWSTSLRYLFEIKDDELDEDETLITPSNLFANYKHWCSENNQKTKSSTKFYMDIRDNIEKTRRSAGLLYNLGTISI